MKKRPLDMFRPGPLLAVLTATAAFGGCQPRPAAGPPLTIRIQVAWPGGSAEETDLHVCQPLVLELLRHEADLRLITAAMPDRADVFILPHATADDAALRRAAEEALSAVQPRLPAGVEMASITAVDIDLSQLESRDEPGVEVELDPDRLVALGLTGAAVVEATKGLPQNADSLAAAVIETPDGRQVPLEEVAAIRQTRVSTIIVRRWPEGE